MTAAAPRLLWSGRGFDDTVRDAAGEHRLLTVNFADPAGFASADRDRRGNLGSGELSTGAPLALVQNRVLGTSTPVEVWLSETPVNQGRHGHLGWAENGSVLFGSLASRLKGDLAAETEAHFGALLAAIEAQGFPHLLRVWNFLPGINSEEAGTERYRLFNWGRAAAFHARYGVTEAEARFSASSAVGSAGESLVTYFACAHTPGRHLGNPRQVHAFHYPADYGPQPPSFTRATISPPELGQILFLSGTASIAGHETRHAGKLQLQLEETLHNIETLLASGGATGEAVARASDGAAGGEVSRLPALEEFDLLRVYLREANDLEKVQLSLRQRLGPRPALIFIEADICRADLLLEIEGVASLHRREVRPS